MKKKKTCRIIIITRPARPLNVLLLVQGAVSHGVNAFFGHNMLVLEYVTR